MNHKEFNCTYLLFAACADVFSCSDDELGRTGRLKHAIDTGNHPPIHRPACIPLLAEGGAETKNNNNVV